MLVSVLVLASKLFSTCTCFLKNLIGVLLIIYILYIFLLKFTQNIKIYLKNV